MRCIHFFTSTPVEFLSFEISESIVDIGTTNIAFIFYLAELGQLCRLCATLIASSAFYQRYSSNEWSSTDFEKSSRHVQRQSNEVLQWRVAISITEHVVIVKTKIKHGDYDK